MVRMKIRKYYFGLPILMMIEIIRIINMMGYNIIRVLVGHRREKSSYHRHKSLVCGISITLTLYKDFDTIFELDLMFL